MMNAIRISGLFHKNDPRKQLHSGPVPGGRFWAIEDYNDLPIWFDSKNQIWEAGKQTQFVTTNHGDYLVEWTPRVVTVSVAELVENSSRLWWRDANDDNNPWIDNSVQSVPTEITRELVDDYDGCSTSMVFSQLVEIYAIPKE